MQSHRQPATDGPAPTVKLLGSLNVSSDIVALRYGSTELATVAQEAGFSITRCIVQPVEDLPMDAVLLEGVKEATQLESTVRHLGIEVDDGLEVAEQTAAHEHSVEAYSLMVDRA